MASRVPPTDPTDSSAAKAREDDTVRPCFTRKLGSQPFRIHTVLCTVMFRHTASADSRNTDRVNSTVLGTAGGMAGCVMPMARQGW